MQSGIYRITNLVNNKQYIGQSCDIYPSIASTRIIGFDPSQISTCINGHIKTHKGYVWKILQE